MSIRAISIFVIATIASSIPVLAQPEPAQVPQVKMYPDKPEADVDPVIAPKPLPNKKLALIGGSIRNIDPIRYRIALDVFGGGRLNAIFDQRTKITKNGKNLDLTKLQRGDHVYLDTQDVNGKVFARQIQVQTGVASAALRGQVIAFDPGNRQLRLRDYMVGEEIDLRFDDSAKVTHHGQPAAPSALAPGAMISADFVPQKDGKKAQTIDIIAAPGEVFTFYGDVTFLDLSRRRLALMNKTDDRGYEVALSGNESGMTGLGIGSEVSVQARFDGHEYVAESLRVIHASALADKKQDQKQ